MLEQTKQLLCRKRFFWPLALFTVLGFGYQVTHFTVDMDDLARGMYLSTESVSQGRALSVLLLRGLHLESWRPYFEDALAAVLLALGAVLLCAVLQRAANGAFSLDACTGFCCLFVTYPLLCEIWNFNGANTCISVNYCLVAIAVWRALDGVERRRWSAFLWAALLLLCAVGNYESSIAVYICLVFAVLVLQYRFGAERARAFGPVLLRGLMMAAPLAAGVLGRALVSSLMRAMLGVPLRTAGNTIFWRIHEPSYCLKQILMGIGFKIGLASFWSFPILLFVLAGIASLVLAVLYCVRYRKPVVLLLFLGLQSSNILLSCVGGAALTYRTSQTFGLFFAFCALLLLRPLLEEKRGIRLRRCVLCAVALLCVWQAAELNRWFSVNDRRSQEELSVVRQVGYELESHYDLSKPVVFIGAYELSAPLQEELKIPDDNPGKILANRLYELLQLSEAERAQGNRKLRVETAVQSYFNWATSAFTDEKETVNRYIVELFHYCGYDEIQAGSFTQYNEAIDAAEDMPVYPREGCVQDKGDYIVVRLGKTFYKA